MGETHPNNLLVCTLEPVRVGQTFENGVPLHVTVQRWFTIGEGQELALHNALINYAHDQSPFPISGGDRALFGPEENIPVTRVARGRGKLAGLHKETGELITRFGVMIDSQWSGDYYNPHVSDHEEQRFEPEAEVVLKALQLIKRDPVGNSARRTVAGVFYFRQDGHKK